MFLAPTQNRTEIRQMVVSVDVTHKHDTLINLDLHRECSRLKMLEFANPLQVVMSLVAEEGVSVRMCDSSLMPVGMILMSMDSQMLLVSR